MYRPGILLRLGLLSVSLLLLLSTPAWAFPSTINATPVDLTTTNASGSIGAAFFQQVSNQSTGTGVIDPFVRLQADGSEQGFDTDFRPLAGDLADVNSSAQFTHSLFVNQFGTVNLNGTPSLRFLLDINQTNNNPLLSMDRFMVFTASTPDIHTNADLFTQHLIYDMGAGNKVLLNYSLNAGSGAGDMLAYLPASMFSGLGSSYLYLYSQFGTSGGSYASNDGFEEWARIDATTPVTSPVPDSRTAMLFGSGLLAFLYVKRRSAA